VAYIFAFAPISLTIMVLIRARFVNSASRSLALHPIRVFATALLLLVFFLVRSWFIHVRHH